MSVIASYPYHNPKMKNIIPKIIAIIDISLIKCSISIDIGVSVVSAEEARFAICPITVLSPVFMHIPYPDPAVQEVPKNAAFLVSKILS
jgi:hypothetical protein